jgi:hypothetical protein
MFCPEDQVLKEAISMRCWVRTVIPSVAEFRRVPERTTALPKRITVGKGRVY